MTSARWYYAQKAQTYYELFSLKNNVGLAFFHGICVISSFSIRSLCRFSPWQVNTASWRQDGGAGHVTSQSEPTACPGLPMCHRALIGAGTFRAGFESRWRGLLLSVPVRRLASCGQTPRHEPTPRRPWWPQSKALLRNRSRPIGVRGSGDAGV